MVQMMKKILIALACSLWAFGAQAVNVLQIGPDGSTGGSYNNTTDTWEFSGSGSFSFNAYNLEGGMAYLVFAAVPQTTDDLFDITVSDDSGALSLFWSGYGTPPVTDPNKLAPHGIYSTWSEVYAINFDGPLVQVCDTQPGQTGCTDGYAENVTVAINDLLDGLTGIHIDLFTIDGQGQVTHFAPNSHDGEYLVPVPAAVWLFGSGLIGLAGIARRKR